MKFFEGCTALITGASAGLGGEFAWQLAPDAHALVLVARRAERLESLKTDLMHMYPHLNVFCYSLDLSDTAAIDRFTKWLNDEGIRVNFLINNAGLGDHGPFENSDWNRIHQIINVNITALTKLTHRLLPMLKSFENSAILNVSSTASLMPVPHLAVYAATKAYVSSFSEALRAELRNSRVSVTALCPGPVDTEFGDVASRPGETRFGPPEILKVPAEHVVRSALQAVARDRARVIPGFVVALSILAIAALPMFLLRWGLNVGAARLLTDEEREGVATGSATS